MGDAVTSGAERTALPSAANVGAVVVAFEPGAGLAERLARVLAQVAFVVVVDNASKTPVAPALAGLDRVRVIRNETNRGLAAALNQGVEGVAAAGADWALTLDDDSIVHPHLVQTYADTLSRHADADRVGQLGCNFWDLNRERPGLHPFYWRFSAVASNLLITSGSLLRIAAYRAAGPFREDFFIDYIDFEYNLRLQRKGWIPLLVSDVLMDHSLGNPVEHRFPKRQLCNHHSPLRTYFKVRNRAYTLREYEGETKDLSHRNMRIGALVRHALLHDRNKLQHVRAILLGLRDAKRGRLGPAPDEIRGGRHA